MQYNLALFVLVPVLTGGCASYNPSVAPIPEAGAMPAWVVEGPVAVGADPYLQLEQQEAVFDAHLTEEGVLPIQVFVQNQGDRPLLIRASDMLLVLSDGRQISSAGATAVAANFDNPDTYFFWGGILGAASANAAQTKRRADYKSKKFRDVTLGENESAHGFAYFIPPAGTPAFTEARLRLHCVDAENARGFVVNLPLSGLKFEGLPREE